MRRPTLSQTLFFVALSCVISHSPAHADEFAPMPTNMSDVMAFPDAPGHFDPTSASDDDLKKYGYPPRPNQAVDAKGYAIWRRLVSNKSRRVIPSLHETGRTHKIKPVNETAQSSPLNSNEGNPSSTVGSPNWSGVVLYSGAKYYSSSSFYAVFGEFSVPPVRPVSNCALAPEMGAIWVGLDGLTSSDVLQAGGEMVADCASGVPSAPEYYLWIEWYPNREYALDPKYLNYHSGDVVLMEVYATSSTTGGVYINDETQGTVVSLSLTPPSGHYLIGDNAEWIVERPGNQYGSLFNLPNYGSAYMDTAVSYILGNNTLAEAGGPSNNLWWQFVVAMADNNNNIISFPTDVEPTSIQWQYVGP